MIANGLQGRGRACSRGRAGQSATKKTESISSPTTLVVRVAFCMGALVTRLPHARLLSHHSLRTTPRLARARTLPATAMWTWMGGGSNQDTLVSHLLRTGRVESPRVAAALRAVDRGAFVAAFDGDGKEHAYLVSGRKVNGSCHPPDTNLPWCPCVCHPNDEHEC